MHPRTSETLNKNLVLLTGAQRNVWFHQRIDLTATSYNAGQHILIEGELDTERLDRIQQQLINQTEVLHLRFIEINQEPYQSPFALTAAQLKQWDLRSDPTPEQTTPKTPKPL